MAQAQPRNLNTIISKHYGGMSVDDYVGTADASWDSMSFFDASGLEVRKQAKNVFSANWGTVSTIGTITTIGHIVSQIAINLTSQAYVGLNGNIYDYNLNLVYQSDKHYYNSTTFNGYWILFKENGKIDRYILDNTVADTGILTSTTYIADPEFLNPASWTVGANWSISWGKATHTSWSTAHLSQTSTMVNGQTYFFRVNGSVTSGFVNVYVNGVSYLTIDPSNIGVTQTFTYTATVWTPLVEFVPSNTATGYIESIYVYGVNIQIDYADLWVTLSTNLPIKQDAWYLYVGSGNKVYRMDMSTSWYASVTALTIDIGYTVKAITYIGDRFYIYASNGIDGIQYLWTGSSVITWGNLAKIHWYDKPIINVANLNNIDYVVCASGTKRSMYKVSGYQSQLLYQSDFIQNSYLSRFNFAPNETNSIETVSNIIYIASDHCIYTYGHINPWVPESLVRQFTIEWSTPSCIGKDNWPYNLNVFYTNGTNVYRSIIPLSSSQYQLDPSTIIYNPIISNLYSSRDSALKVRIGYDLQTGTRINLYTKPDSNGWFSNLYIDTFDGTHFPAVWDVYTYLGNNYTIYAITNSVGSNYGILHCTVDDTTPIEIRDINRWGATGTLVRSTGSWPSSLVFYRRTLGMELVKTITDATVHKDLTDVSDPCYQMTLMVDLITFNSTYTATLWDLVYAYQNIENDI